MCIQTFAIRSRRRREQALRDLVLVVGKDEIDPAAVDVEQVAARVVAREAAAERFESVAIDIAEHSICQPGRPSAAIAPGLGQPGSLGFEGFHSTKSIGSRLYGATSTRAPASISSSERRASAP